VGREERKAGEADAHQLPLVGRKSLFCRRSAVRLDRSFDDFGLLSQQVSHMRSHELGRESHRFVRTVLVLEDAE
jgi:hypothetical protein